MNEIRFYGYDIIRYYWYIWQNSFSDYSWQIYIAYFVVLFSIGALLYLTINYSITYNKNKRFNKKLYKIHDKYYQKIYDILVSDKLENHDIITKLGVDYVDDIGNPKLFIPIITKVHMETKLNYFPNMGALCSLLDITDYCENNLLKENDVFITLQFLCINQIIIMEGRLANYVNHKDIDIRMMARLCYIFCAYNDPYKYLEDELKTPSDIKFMLLHYIFVWMQENGKQLPNFKELKKSSDIKSVIDFLNNEENLLC